MKLYDLDGYNKLYPEKSTCFESVDSNTIYKIICSIVSMIVVELKELEDPNDRILTPGLRVALNCIAIKTNIYMEDCD